MLNERVPSFPARDPDRAQPIARFRVNCSNWVKFRPDLFVEGIIILSAAFSQL
jgi:hypothetical protein